MQSEVLRLRPKQEAFALRYAETGNASQAYRESYDAERMSDGAVYVEAHRLCRHPKIALRIELQQKRVTQKSEITVELLTQWLTDVYEKAMVSNKVGVAVSATMAIAKVHGLLQRPGHQPIVHECVKCAELKHLSSSEITARIRQLIEFERPT